METTTNVTATSQKVEEDDEGEVKDVIDDNDEESPTKPAASSRRFSRSRSRSPNKRRRSPSRSRSPYVPEPFPPKRQASVPLPLTRPRSPFRPIHPYPSPPPPRSQPRRSSPPSSHQPLFFGRGRLVVVLMRPEDQDRQESAWKDVFRHQKFLMYDNKYPFRMAAETILRQNKQYRQSSCFRPMRSNRYAEFLLEQTSKFFGENFETDYFMDWAKNLSSNDRRQPIVVFGITEGSKLMVDNLRRVGAMVLSPPQAGGDYIMHTTRDLEKFLKDL